MTTEGGAASQSQFFAFEAQPISYFAFGFSKPEKAIATAISSQESLAFIIKMDGSEQWANLSQIGSPQAAWA